MSDSDFKKLKIVPSQPLPLQTKEEEANGGDGGSGDLTPPSVYEEKALLTRHEIEKQVLSKYGAVIAQDRKRPEGGDYSNGLAAHPILSKFQAFDGIDPKVAIVPGMSEDAAAKYLEYQLDYQARNELSNAKRRKFNPSPSR